jgi:hypothetical protein
MYLAPRERAAAARILAIFIDEHEPFIQLGLRLAKVPAMLIK